MDGMFGSPPIVEKERSTEKDERANSFMIHFDIMRDSPRIYGAQYFPLVAWIRVGVDEFTSET